MIFILYFFVILFFCCVIAWWHKEEERRFLDMIRQYTSNYVAVNPSADEQEVMLNFLDSLLNYKSLQDVQKFVFNNKISGFYNYE